MIGWKGNHTMVWIIGARPEFLQPFEWYLYVLWKELGSPRSMSSTNFLTTFSQYM
jgi:hypothetical protein